MKKWKIEKNKKLEGFFVTTRKHSLMTRWRFIASRIEVSLFRLEGVRPVQTVDSPRQRENKCICFVLCADMTEYGFFF